MVDKAEGRAASAAFWGLVLHALAHGSWHDTIAAVVKRRGWSEKRARPEDSLARKSGSLNEAQLRGLVLEILIGRHPYSTWGEPFGNILREACKLYGVELGKLHARVKTEMAGEMKAKQQGKRSPKEAKTRR